MADVLRAGGMQARVGRPAFSWAVGNAYGKAVSNGHPPSGVAY
jgi:hypothetical protein